MEETKDTELQLELPTHRAHVTECISVVSDSRAILGLCSCAVTQPL